MLVFFRAINCSVLVKAMDEQLLSQIFRERQAFLEQVSRPVFVVSFFFRMMKTGQARIQTTPT